MEYLIIALIALSIPLTCLLAIGAWFWYWVVKEEVMDIKRRIDATNRMYK